VTLWIRQLELGPMRNFVYLVGLADRPETAVIDAAWDVGAIAAELENAGRKLTHALVTHRHPDHTNGLKELVARFDVPVFAHADDASQLPGDLPPSTLRRVTGGEVVEVGGLPIRCIHTPGHTAGSQCFHLGVGPGALVSGDTVFVNACGRCDLTGGDAERLYDSISRVLGALPGETTVYPGHDYGDVKVSTLARERARNPYFQLSDKDAFVAYRMRPRA
jgi:hydroxyacylglutathione hydrolase